MKATEIQAALEKGTPLVLAEWRSGEPKRLTGTAAQSGKPYDIRQVEHNVEIAGKPVTIVEPLPDNTDVDSYKIPFIKGQQVAITLELTDVGKGMWRVKGKFESYAPAAK